MLYYRIIGIIVFETISNDPEKEITTPAPSQGGCNNSANGGGFNRVHSNLLRVHTKKKIINIDAIE